MSRAWLGLTTLFASSLAAQHVPAAGSSAAAFVPPGWTVLAHAAADFNLDGHLDVVMILDSVEGPRPLLILLGEAGGGLRLAARADTLAPDRESGGILSDGFDTLFVRRNTFILGQSGGSSIRTGWTKQFRLHAGRWTLIGVTRTRAAAAGSLECPEVTLKPDESCISFNFDHNVVTGSIVEAWEVYDGKTEKSRLVVTRSRAAPQSTPDPSFVYF